MNASSSRYVSRRPGIFTWAIAAIALQGLLTLSGCGDDDNATTPALRSLQITPANPSLAAGTSVQLAATATYSDGSQADVTTQVAWTSSNTAVASLGAATGKALAVSVGSSVVTAMMGGVTSAPITLTVTPATLVSLVVTPPSPSIALGMQQQFTATGTYTDNSTQNLTSQVTWRSTAATVATISNAAGSNGLARSISAGTSLVTATMASIASPPITVTVTAATLVAIQVQAVRPKIPLGTTRQLTATGTYTDNTTQDLTTLATWMSADSSIVSISNASGSQGRATGVAQGTTTVGATLGPVSSPPVSLTTTVARYAYVASFDAVYQYSIDARGALSPMTPAKVAAGAAPYSVAVDPTGRYAYVANLDDGTVSQYIIGAGGSLSPMTPATVATAGTG
ncbi:MAG: Ig-like domain-containing protein, partial [Gammaproteobacteria bacterium]|nr:Ig-like domain-containing protein [Gammaproteobacteria bacterium]